MSTVPFQGTSAHHLPPHTPAPASDHPLAPSRYTNSLPSGSGILHLSTPSSSSSHSSDTNTYGKPPPTGRARFTTLIASYPLKLLSPTPLPSSPRNLATVYTLAYGGGLVAADTISLRVSIDPRGILIMLTQGSTKVFKRRPGLRPRSHILPGDTTTKQRMYVTIKPGGLLLLLPDSISPFRNSRYTQSQRFILPSNGDGSLVVLDWVNSGRGTRQPTAVSAIQSEEGEEIWDMDSYISTNEVLIGDWLIMRERMVLDNTTTHTAAMNGTPAPAPAPHPPGLSSVAKRMAPYHAYATILIYGPLVTSLLDHLRGLCEATQQFQIQRPPDLTWSYSDVEGGKGGIVRVAGKRIEGVRDWIREILLRGGIKDLVGEGIWPRVI